MHIFLFIYYFTSGTEKCKQKIGKKKKKMKKVEFLSLFNVCRGLTRIFY